MYGADQAYKLHSLITSKSRGKAALESGNFQNSSPCARLPSFCSRTSIRQGQPVFADVVDVDRVAGHRNGFQLLEGRERMLFQIALSPVASICWERQPLYE